MTITDDFGDSFLIRCDQADVYRDMNGLCYNYSGHAGLYKNLNIQLKLIYI
jgi:hypothetical protein